MAKDAAAAAVVDMVVVAEVTWQACVESTLAVDGAISLAAVFTMTAWVAPITRHTPRPTPATTEWQVDTKAPRPRLSLSPPRIRTGERNVYSPRQPCKS